MSLGISMELQLPRDNATVPIVRHILRTTLQEIGVRGEWIGDVELAVTEACANVILHADGEDAYEVRVSVAQSRCEIRIIDTGEGLRRAVPDGFPAADAGTAGACSSCRRSWTRSRSSPSRRRARWCTSPRSSSSTVR